MCEGEGVCKASVCVSVWMFKLPVIYFLLSLIVVLPSTSLLSLLFISLLPSLLSFPPSYPSSPLTLPPSYPPSLVPSIPLTLPPSLTSPHIEPLFGYEHYDGIGACVTLDTEHRTKTLSVLLQETPWYSRWVMWCVGWCVGW